VITSLALDTAGGHVVPTFTAAQAASIAAALAAEFPSTPLDRSRHT